ncbi:MAG TPA: trehalose-6-phosphate synthase [Streptosporangiaceae bacterium]|nr:trehalose-6-phosphate synthase [Streptosporangiaceae bacterium]
MRRRVLVASNRGPVSYHFGTDGTLTGRRGGGGMIAGVASGLAGLPPETEVTWLCAALSDADRAAAAAVPAAAGTGQDAAGSRAGEAAAAAGTGQDAAAAGTGQDAGTGPGPAGVPVRMLDIPPEVFDRAYNGVANSTLWFLHHLLFDTPNQPRFGAEFRRDWQAYLAYNQAFAEALADEAAGGGREPARRGGARVLVQDYHLALVPRLLRDRLAGTRPDVRIAHFWHTPWAPADYYRLLPGEAGRALLDGLLGADHLGFHCGRWAAAFLDCCQAVLGAAVTGAERGDRRAVARVAHRGRVTEVAVHPLGVDAPALRARARAEDVQQHLGALRRAAGGRKLIVRVDRTELSKNIVRGLAAYRELLAARPRWRGRVVHLAFAYPSRSGLPEYRAYTDEVRRAAREITAEFGTADWDPLLLEVRDDYPRSLAACALADVLLVNPIRDGMNLVAQEGPVLSERGCALVLSAEAGAAATLGDGALLVNPYDVSETAAALDRALAMPDEERRRRSAALAEAAAACAPSRWLGDQLAALDVAALDA